MQKMIQKYGLIKREFHGCQYGLTSIRPATWGQPLNKAWYGLTNDIKFAKGIGAICGNQQCRDKHVQVGGKDTQITEQYTEELARKVQQLFEERAHGVLERNCTHDKAVKA